MRHKGELLAASWSSSAIGYGELLVPRFAPWTNDVLQVVAENVVTDSRQSFSSSGEAKGDLCCCVPCCGPGQELLPLKQLLGDSWYILGMDLAPGMIEVAQKSLDLQAKEDTDRIHCMVADCSTQLPMVPDQISKTIKYYDLIVSVFGFQQMPDPEATLKAWLNSLTNEGVMVLCFWPSSVEALDDTPQPFRAWTHAVAKLLMEHNDYAKKSSTPSRDKNSGKSKQEDTKNNQSNIPWDDRVVSLARKEAHIVTDEFRVHEMEWSSKDEFWNAMTRAGPWNAARLKRGDEFVDSLQETVCSVFADNDNVVHKSRARLLVLRKKERD